jgi:hypothetical protein
VLYPNGVVRLVEVDDLPAVGEPGLRPLHDRDLSAVNYLLSAGSVLIALPGAGRFFALQKQFVAGLTLGATKG